MKRQNLAQSLTILLLAWTPHGFAQTSIKSASSGTTTKVSNGSAQAGAQSSELSEAASLEARVVGFYKQGKYDEALPLAKRVVELREKANVVNPQSVAIANANLAALFLGKKDYGAAKQSYARALALYEQQPGTDNPKIANLLEMLAFAQTATRDYDKAAASYARVVAIREKALGRTHPSLATPLLRLAELSQAKGRKDEARGLYERALEVYEAMTKPLEEGKVKTLESYLCLMSYLEKPETKDGLQSRVYKVTSSPNLDLSPFEDPKLTEAIMSATEAGVLNGKAVTRYEPPYPLAAKNQRVSGTVIVRVSIDETGKVVEANSLCGPELLLDAAVDAARRWRFSPTLQQGKPVKVNGTISFMFALG